MERSRGVCTCKQDATDVDVVAVEVMQRISEGLRRAREQDAEVSALEAFADQVAAATIRYERALVQGGFGALSGPMAATFAHQLTAALMPQRKTVITFGGASFGEFFETGDQA